MYWDKVKQNFIEYKYKIKKENLTEEAYIALLKRQKKNIKKDLNNIMNASHNIDLDRINTYLEELNYFKDRIDEPIDKNFQLKQFSFSERRERTKQHKLARDILAEYCSDFTVKDVYFSSRTDCKNMKRQLISSFINGANSVEEEKDLINRYNDTNAFDPVHHCTNGEYLGQFFGEMFKNTMEVIDNLAQMHDYNEFLKYLSSDKARYFYIALEFEKDSIESFAEVGIKIDPKIVNKYHNLYADFGVCIGTYKQIMQAMANPLYPNLDISDASYLGDVLDSNILMPSFKEDINRYNDELNQQGVFDNFRMYNSNNAVLCPYDAYVKEGKKTAADNFYYYGLKNNLEYLIKTDGYQVDYNKITFKDGQGNTYTFDKNNPLNKNSVYQALIDGKEIFYAIDNQYMGSLKTDNNKNFGLLSNTRKINPFKLSEKLDKLLKKNEKMLKELNSLTKDAQYAQTHGLKFDNQRRLAKLQSKAIKLEKKIEKETLKTYKKNIKALAQYVKKETRHLPERLRSKEINTIVNELNDLSKLKNYNSKEMKARLTNVMNTAVNTLSHNFTHNEMFSNDPQVKKIISINQTIYETAKGATIEISNFSEKFTDKLLWTITDSNLNNIDVKKENKQSEKQNEIIKDDKERIALKTEEVEIYPNQEQEASLSTSQKEIASTTVKDDSLDIPQK